VGVAAEGPVADQDVAGPQRRVQGGGVGRVVAAQRQGQGPPQQAGRVVEEGHQVGRREAAAGRLAAGLAEMPLQLRRIRHREPRAVEEEQAVAFPAAAGGPRQVGTDRVGDPALQGGEERQREPGPGLAVGRGVDRGAAEVAEVGAGGVAVQDLPQEEAGGDDRAELALAPPVAGLLAGLVDEGVGDVGGEVILDVADCLLDSSHPWPPGYEGGVANPSCPEATSSASPK
jgi:hypothetical protein